MKETSFEIGRDEYFKAWHEGASYNVVNEHAPSLIQTVDFMLNMGALSGQRTLLKEEGNKVLPDNDIIFSAVKKNGQHFQEAGQVKMYKREDL